MFGDRGARWLSGRVSDSGARGRGLCPWARHFTPRNYCLITQEAVAPSRHDWKIVDWDVKPQHKQTNKYLAIDTASHWVIFSLLPFLATFSSSKTLFFLHFPTTCFRFEVLLSLNRWFLTWINQLKHPVGPYFCIILVKFLDRWWFLRITVLKLEI